VPALLTPFPHEPPEKLKTRESHPSRRAYVPVPRPDRHPDLDWPRPRQARPPRRSLGARRGARRTVRGPATRNWTVFLALVASVFAILCGCGKDAPEVTVSGKLEFVGAAASVAPAPVAGVITFRGPHVYRVQVGRNGRYRVAVLPGKYTVIGKDDNYPLPCPVRKPVVLKTLQGTTVDVFCEGGI
jgi:hypothetical protein